jgi:hypothetical protein
MNIDITKEITTVISNLTLTIEEFNIIKEAVDDYYYKERARNDYQDNQETIRIRNLTNKLEEYDNNHN